MFIVPLPADNLDATENGNGNDTESKLDQYIHIIGTITMKASTTIDNRNECCISYRSTATATATDADDDGDGHASI